MAKAFNLTAQLNLQGPNNLKPIVSKIKKELGSIKADVKFNLDAKAAKSVDDIKNKLLSMNSALVKAKNNTNDLNAALRNLSSSLGTVRGGSAQVGTSINVVAKAATSTAKNLKTASSQMEEFGKQGYLAVKRFAAFSIVAGSIYKLVNAVSSGLRSFIEFDKQLVRLEQVTGDNQIALKSLSDEITRLSTTFGVSSASITEAAVTLAQAGLSANQTRQALEALAKTELAPSFDNITDTTEGAIAAMRQFGIASGDLEKALGSINAVAAAFAVESSDIITAIQRTGGAFAASSTGVSEGTKALNEFIAVFTSVRATTRESAETIATGLRTIFTRIQRPQTIEFLKEFGVNLTDLDGKFVGPYEGVRRLSQVLNKLDPRDLRFSQIVEELGGFRQISKVIPLIQQFAEAEKALKIAQEGQGSLTKAQEIAQKSLAVQLAKVREEFLALIKAVAQSDTFQSFFKIVIGLSSALIKLAGAFKPILPALAILGTIKGGQALTQFAGGFFGAFKKGGGAQAAGGALGGSLTGTTERQNAEVTSKATEALRSNTSALTILTTSVDSLTRALNDRTAKGLNSGGKVTGFARGGVVPGSGNGDTVPAMLQPGEFVIRKKAVETLGAGNLHRMNKYAAGGKVIIDYADESIATDTIDSSIATAVNSVAKQLNPGSKLTHKNIAKNFPNYAGIVGSIFEGGLKAASVGSFDAKNADTQPFDFPNGLNLSAFPKVKSAIAVDAKRNFYKTGKYGDSDKILRKIYNFSGGNLDSLNGQNFGIAVMNKGIDDEFDWNDANVNKAVEAQKKYFGGKIQKFAEGGEVVQRGTINYLKSDIEKAMIDEGLTYADFFKRIPTPNSAFDQFMVGGIGPESKPFPRFLKPYVAKSKAQEEAEIAAGKKAARINDALLRKGRPGLGDSERRIDERFNRRQFAAGGLVQKFLNAGEVEDVETYKLTDISQTSAQILATLGGLSEAASIGGITAGEVKTALTKNKKLTPSLEVAQQKLLAQYHDIINKSGIKEAESINKALKLGIVGLEPLGFSENRSFDTGFGKAALLIRGLPNRPEYANLIDELRSGVSKLSINLASGLQSATAFGGNQPIALDFDETLVSGADIFDEFGNIDIPAYSDLNKVKEALKKGKLTPLAEKLKSILEFDPSFIDRIRILTARNQSNAPLLSERLNQLGLSIPANKITGTSGGGSAKATALGASEKLIDDNYENILAAIRQGKSAKQYAELRDISEAESRASGVANAEGAVLQLALARLGAQGGTIKEAALDFEKGLGLQTSGIFGLPPDIPTEVKRTLSSAAIGRAEDEFTRYFSENYGPFPKGSDVYGIDKTTGLPFSRFNKGGSVEDKKKEKNYGKIGLRSSGSEVTATYLKNADRQGFVSAKKFANNLFTVGLSRATSGYGPRLYDVVMEAVTAQGGMLTSDRNQVSSDAKGVWAYYFKNRGDVKKTPLEDPSLWTKNQQYIDPKLYGKKETWPPATDPAWTLQSGYSKSPELLNSPDVMDLNDPKYADFIRQQQLGFLERNKGGPIARFATGGNISGQDTVPALLTPGEFVINKKAAQKIGYSKLTKLNQADKLQGYNRGGPVGYVQRFASGGTPDPRVVAALEDAAKRVGLSLEKFSDKIKAESIEKALARVASFKATRTDLRSEIVRTTARGLGDRDSQKAFASSLQSKIKELNPNAKTGDINKAVGEIFRGIKAGKTFDEMLRSATSSLKPLNDALDGTADNTRALKEAQDALISEFGGLTDAVEATIDELEATDYKNSGQAGKDFGIFGEIFTQQALDYKKSASGAKALASAQKFQTLGIKGVNEALGKLPGPIGDAVKNIGGLPGVISVAASAFGQLVTDMEVFGDSVTGAGITGALTGGGEQALALGTLGQNIFGDIGGKYGTIAGAIGGAIEGFITSSKTKQIENRLNDLGKATEAATTSLNNLSELDNETNYKAALKNVDALRENIGILGQESQSTFSEKLGVGAAGGIMGYGLGTAAGTFLAPTLAPAIAGGLTLTGTAATAAGLTTIGTAVTAFAATVSTAGVALAIAAVAAIGYGIYKFVQGTSEVDKAALEGSLKATENYVKGINQLAERRAKLTSLADIETNIKAYQRATTPEEKAALGKESYQVKEARRGARERGQDENVAEKAIAYSMAVNELSQQLGGNVDAIEKEKRRLGDPALIQRGLELAAQQSNQLDLQRRMAAAMVEVNVQSERFVSLFEKMNSAITRVDTESEAAQARLEELTAAMSGRGTMGSVNRRDEDVLKNAQAYNNEEFQATLSRVGALAGGGENARKLTESLAAKRNVEAQLPTILRNVTQQNLGEVSSQLNELFSGAGISPDVSSSIIDEIKKEIESKTGGRQGVSYDELANSEALTRAFANLNAAQNTALNLVTTNNNLLTKYNDNLNKVNEALTEELNLKIKGIQIQDELNMMIDEINGRKDGTTRADTFDRELKLLTGGITDPRAIGAELDKAFKELSTLRTQPLPTDSSDLQKRSQKEAQLVQRINNLNRGLNGLANSTERAAQIMDKFRNYMDKQNHSVNMAERFLTADSEEALQMIGEMQAATAVKEGRAGLASSSLEFRTRAIAGMQYDPELQDPQKKAQFMGNIVAGLPPEQAQLINGLIAVQDKNNPATWAQVFGGEVVSKFENKLKEVAEIRLQTVEVLSNIQDNIITAYNTANDRLIESMDNLTTTMGGITPETPTSAAAATSAAADIRLPQTNNNETMAARHLSELSALRTEIETELNDSIEAKRVLDEEVSGLEGILANIFNANFRNKIVPELKAKAAKLKDLQNAKNLIDKAIQQPPEPVTRPLPKATQDSTPTPRETRTTAATTPTTGGPAVATRTLGLLTIDDNSKAFLTSFQTSMDKFGTYVDKLSNLKIPTIPEKIEMQGRHTVQVDIRGAELFEKMKTEFGQLITNEVQTQMQKQWQRSNGELGSSGAGGRYIGDIAQ